MTTASNKTQTYVRGTEFVMERTFNAPRELVFRALSEAEHLKHWWGPVGWTLPVCEVDFRPGGVWLYCMSGPDEMKSWGRAVYQEIVAPERLVYIDTFADEHGNVLEGMPQMLITEELIDVGGKTKLVSTTKFASAEELERAVGMGMEEGAKQTWDRLAEHVETA